MKYPWTLEGWYILFRITKHFKKLLLKNLFSLEFLHCTFILDYHCYTEACKLDTHYTQTGSLTTQLKAQLQESITQADAVLYVSATKEIPSLQIPNELQSMVGLSQELHRSTFQGVSFVIFGETIRKVVVARTIWYTFRYLETTCAYFQRPLYPECTHLPETAHPVIWAVLPVMPVVGIDKLCTMTIQIRRVLVSKAVERPL